MQYRIPHITVHILLDGVVAGYIPLTVSKKNTIKDSNGLWFTQSSVLNTVKGQLCGIPLSFGGFISFC
jgi:hypothetical protein